MANIPIRDIPGAVVASPDPSNLIPMDNGSIMQKTTIANAVNATLPLSSQAEAEAGSDNAKRMSPLRTKQAIDAQAPVIVNTAITALNLGTMSQEEASDYTPTANLAAVALSNDYDDLDNLPTLGTAAATDASDYATAAQGTLASTAVQPDNAALVPAGGTAGQVLAKTSGDDYATGWTAAGSGDMTKVEYDPQGIDADAFDRANFTGEDGRAEFATASLAAAAEFPAIPSFIRTAGLRDANDGGGGLYTNPVEAEPAIGPKLFNAHVNRWFTGSETVMDIMRFGARNLGSGTSGVIADNNAAFEDAKDWLHGRLIAGASPELQFGPGVYDYSQFPDIARNRARVIGKGEVKLRFHGSGNALVLDGKANSNAGLGPVSDGVWEMKFMGFQVEAPLSANGDGIVIKAIHESDFDIETRGARFAGLRLHWLVSSRIRFRCAGNGFGWYDAAEPDYGIYVDDHDTPIYFGDETETTPDYTATSFCHIHADLTATPYGIYHALSNGNMVRGTFQSHDFVAVHMGANCQDNVLFNSDMEANLDTALLCLGKHNTISNCVSLDPIVFAGAAEGNRILGGIHESILLTEGTSGNVIDTNYNRTGSSTIADNGVRNSIARSFNVVTKQFRSRDKQTLSVTPTGTVYNWINPYGDPVVIAFSGGTIEGFQIDNENVVPPPPGGAQHLVPPGKMVAWDASVAPTVKVWGL